MLSVKEFNKTVFFHMLDVSENINPERSGYVHVQIVQSLSLIQNKHPVNLSIIAQLGMCTLCLIFYRYFTSPITNQGPDMKSQ